MEDHLRALANHYATGHGSLMATAEWAATLIRLGPEHVAEALRVLDEGTRRERERTDAFNAPWLARMDALPQ